MDTKFVQCTICRKKIRKRRNFNPKSNLKYPAYHLREKNQPCHGFFVEARDWKE